MLTQEQIATIRASAGAPPIQSVGKPTSLVDTFTDAAPVTKPQPDYGKPFTELATGHPVKAVGSALQLGAEGILSAPGDILDAAKSGIERAKQGVEQINKGGALNDVEGALKTGSGLASIVTSPLASISKPIGAAVQKAADVISDVPAVQEFAGTPAGEVTSRVAEDTADAANIAGTVIGAKGVLGQVPKVVKGGQDFFKNSSKAISDIGEVPPEQLDQHITENFNKAIKPSVAGKNTASAVEKYYENAVSAVKSIVQNKEGIQLRDEFGDPTGHALPKNIEQFSQAIEQTKGNIFRKYDDLAKRAGAKGADVQLSPIADELNKIAEDGVTKDLHPELAAYAKSRADALSGRGVYSMENAQKAVQNLNQSLEAFYKNPSYETASRASIDALIANKLRIGLDDAVAATIDEVVGTPGYQELKNQYGALRAVEKDVAKRGVMLARETGGRGLSFGDVTSAEEVIRGLATMNPQSVVTGGLIKSALALKRYLTDPNRSVAKMFETVDRTLPKPQPVPESVVTAAERHLQEAQQVIDNVDPQHLKALGGVPELNKRTLINIVDGLEAEGFSEAANLVRELDPSMFSTVASLRDAVHKLLGNTTP